MKLESDFSDAGINQTRWRILLHIECSVGAWLAGGQAAAMVPGDFVLIDTVLTGRVPEAYTSVIADETENLARLNGYRAKPKTFHK